jgi:hypothetical protein
MADRDTWQQYMNEAHEKWPPGAKVADVARELDADHRVAFVIGKLNSQVCNGGFFQWHDNGYSDLLDDTVWALQKVDTETSRKVVGFLGQVHSCIEAQRRMEEERSPWEDVDEDELYDEVFGALGPLDDAYYKVNDQLEADVEAYLRARRAA